MPAPAVVGVYVLAAVGTVAAGVAFKEFVYEPHIAPRIERWAENFLARREARKRARNAIAVPVSSSDGSSKRDGDDGRGLGDEGGSFDGKSTYELESLISQEVRQWREGVDVGPSSGLRHRRTGGAPPALDESNIIIPYSPMSPTHVLFDPNDGLSVSSPTSTISSRVPTPASTLSHESFRAPPPQVPTPDPSVRGSPTRALASSARTDIVDTDPCSSPSHVPSLSLSHPLDLESEADLALLSASTPTSSRPVSPFSDFSSTSQIGGGGGGHEQFYSFASMSTVSPEITLGVLSASESGSGSEAGDELDADLDRWSNAGSEISGSSWASVGVSTGAGARSG
ncbi:hypothetical protein FB45DRAFT_934830 [Roridomyces roridus]|uniref:Uncharacterized protein n=1 Tax=Roridomyces roridus TaxID=1738132 RepID=A0AAD7BBC9_9AGAR|nr:hypothetical protein FB45DRAFT_934830 [Roridomyces roridus]